MRKIQKIQFTRSQLRLLIMAGIIAGIFIAFLSFVVLPYHLKIRTLDAEVKQFFAESQKAQETMLSTNRSGSKFESTLEKLDKYKKMAPTPEVLTRVLDRAGSSAEKFHLGLVSLKTKTDEKISGPDGKPFVDEGREARILRVEMVLQGSFFSLGNYLAAMENAGYKIIVKEIDIRNPTVDAKGSGSSDLQIQIVLGVLIMREPE